MLHDKFRLSQQILHHLSGLVRQGLRLCRLVILRIQSRDHTTKVVHPESLLQLKAVKPVTTFQLGLEEMSNASFSQLTNIDHRLVVTFPSVGGGGGVGLDTTTLRLTFS